MGLAFILNSFVVSGLYVLYKNHRLDILWLKKYWKLVMVQLLK